MYCGEWRPQKLKFKKTSFLVFIIIILPFYFILNYINPFSGTFNDDWSLLSVNPDDVKKINLPVRFPGNDNLEIEKKIPEGADGKYLYFFSSDQSVCVFIDNEVIYEYGTKKKNFPFHNPTADNWNEIKIKKEYEGKTLKVFFTYPYKLHSGRIFNMYLSEPKTFFRNLSIKYWFSLVFGLFCLTACGLIFSFSSIFNKRLSEIRPIAYIAIFAFLSGVWSLSDNKIFLLIFSMPSLLTALSILALILIDLPPLLYVSSLKNFCCVKFVKLFTFVKILIASVIIILEIFLVIDIYSYKSILHIYMYLSIIVYFVAMFIGIFKSKRKDLIRPTLLYLLVVLGSLVDMFLYITNQEAYSANYTSFAVSIFISALFVIASGVIREAMTENKKASMYKDLASQDFMTGTKNKSAFFRDVDKLILSKKLGALTFDINDLKLINDKYGHESGDDAVIFIASLINELFGKIGECYRSGTDEFTVIIKNCEDLDIYELIKNFIFTMNMRAKELAFPIGVAIGSATFDPKIDSKFKDTVRRAKDKMKKNKTSQKLAE